MSVCPKVPRQCRSDKSRCSRYADVHVPSLRDVGTYASRLRSRLVWELLTSVLPLGLAVAITPTLFALQVLVVSGPHWQPRARAVVVGAGGVFLVLFVLVLGGLSQLPDAGSGTKPRWEYGIEFACGLLLMIAAIWMLRPHPQADARLEEKVQGYADHASPWMFAGLAAYMSVTDFSSLIILLPALHDVTNSAVPVAGKALVVVLLYVCVLLPVVVPPLAVRVSGGRGVQAMKRLYALVMGHQVQVMGAVAGVVGVILIVRGVRGLW